MPLSEARKRANAKYQAEHQKTLACSVSTYEHAAFKAYAEARGKTISGLLLEYVRSCIAEGTDQRPE